jgi:hypothetical protein
MTQEAPTSKSEALFSVSAEYFPTCSRSGTIKTAAPISDESAINRVREHLIRKELEYLPPLGTEEQ